MALAYVLSDFFGDSLEGYATKARFVGGTRLRDVLDDVDYARG